MSDEQVTVSPGPTALVRYEAPDGLTVGRAILDLEYLCLILGVTHPGEWPMVRATQAPDIDPEGALYVIDLCCDRVVTSLQAQQNLTEALVAVAVAGPAGDGPRQQAVERYTQVTTYVSSFRRALMILDSYRQSVEASSATTTEGVAPRVLGKA